MQEDQRAQRWSPGSGMGRAVAKVPPFLAEATRKSLQGTEMETVERSAERGSQVASLIWH